MTEEAPGSFLFAMFYGGGNVSLILPVVRRLVARGHNVRVLAGPRLWSRSPGPPEPFLEALRGTGARVIPLPEAAVNAHDTAPPPRGLIWGWTPRRLKKAGNSGIASRWSSVWADATADQLRQQRPDLLVADHFLLGAAAAAERAGVRFAVLVHNAIHVALLPGLPPPGTGFAVARNTAERARDVLWGAAFQRVLERDTLPLLNRTRADLGLAPVRTLLDQYNRAERVLILASAGFDFPTCGLPANVRYAGTVRDDARVGA